MVVASDGETDGADTSIEVEDVVGGDVVFNLGESHFVNGEVNLEKAVGGIRVGVAEDGVGEIVEGGVGLVVFVEAAGDFAVLAATEEEGLVLAGLGVLGVEVGYNCLGASENFGAFDTGACDRDFAVGAAGVEGEADLARGVVPVEGVFHFVAVVVVATVGEDCWGGDGNLVLAEDFDY